jgi:ATP-dependent RNA helicase DDX24/MAK5
MAPEQKKRARPVPKLSQRSKKRQKMESVVSNVVTRSMKLPVALDELPWNDVEIPDMFEDAEGFFGLEEADGVEVIRDGNKVQFVSVWSNNYVSGKFSL